MLARTAAVICAALLLVGVAAATAGSGTARTARVSVSSRGGQAELDSRLPSISRTGRYVAFSSEGTRLVPHDTNHSGDVFRRDLKIGKTIRVSVSSRGAQGSMISTVARISGDGRYVAFQSEARNLASGDTDNGWDVFVRDVKRKRTTLASILPNGQHGGTLPSISADGRYVAFDGEKGARGEVFVRDLRTHRTERVTISRNGGQPNGPSYSPSISGDGRRVAFDSYASDLVPGDTNEILDVFVRDLKTDRTEMVSVSTKPQQQGAGFNVEPSISADGRFVAFQSAADLISGDPNGKGGIFRRDLERRKTERISVSSAGAVEDRTSWPGAISANGRFVAFGSYSTNLVPGDTNERKDIFLRDVSARRTMRVSVSSGGAQGKRKSDDPAISGDGRLVAFRSNSWNLVAHDTNATSDVFVRGPLRP
jgi:Tol biopolymer transport system component